MVLASNEWLNNCDDDQKSATANTTTNTPTTTATATTPATTTTTLSIPATTTTTAVSTTTGPTNNANNEEGQLHPLEQKLKIDAPKPELSMIYSNSLKIMAENNPNEPNTATTTTTKTTITTTTTTTSNNANPNPDLKQQNDFENTKETTIKNESENNNQLAVTTTLEEEQQQQQQQEQQQEQDSLNAIFLQAACGENVANANNCNSANNTETNCNQSQPNSHANSNSNPNSNTSTLVQASTALVRQSKSTPIITPQPLSSPITPQALSSALQSVMNNPCATIIGGNIPISQSGIGTKARNSMQQAFLATLGIGTENGSSTLQQTAKSASFEPSSFGNSSSVGGGGGTSLTSNLDAPAASAPVALVDHAGGGNGVGGNQVKIILLCESNSHPFQTRTIVLKSNVECKVGRLIAKSKAAESNAIFDCKVLSRNHAVLWYSGHDGKFWVKDTKSSNGTFINENKLGSDAAELHFGDIVKFGVDVLENSRKEVHGCIIACVKLYLPDGREAISIDGSQQAQQQRSQYSGEGRISFDELHRLNLYMQEASQRESLLKSKLFNIQNILDATRKNSAVCWQSMIAEDQLLHRIHSLEKKLQMMEKNVPESVLRNEVLKLIDDKNAYQHTAKEALRKVYQERCDAMQMLSKVEAAYTTSDNECKILRDQIMNTKQSLLDVNARLLRLETEYNEFKEETERQQQEAKEQEEQRTVELTEKLKQRELDCEELRRKISELLVKRAELLDDEEQLQKQAIEKLDAAIADMDLGDDDDDDEDENDEANDYDEDDDDGVHDDVDNGERHKAEAAVNEADVVAHDKKKKRQRSSAKERRKKSHSDELKSGVEHVTDAISNSSDSEKEKTDASPKNVAGGPQMPAKQKVAKESTIMKWLQNSDLNKTAGSLEIFQAICNESDSSDERDDAIKTDGGGAGEAGATGAGANATTATKKFTKFPNKLRHVQKYIKQLEKAIANETAAKPPTATNLLASLAAAAAATSDGSAIFAADDDSEDDDDDEEDDEGDEVDDEFIIKRNGKLNEVLSKETAGVLSTAENKNYIALLKRSVAMLSEAYNEIWDNVQEQLEQQKTQHKNNSGSSSKAAIEHERSPPPAINVQTQFQNYAQHKPSNSAAKKLHEPPETLRTLPAEFANAANNSTTEDEDDDDDDDAEDADGEEEEADVEQDSRTTVSEDSLSASTTRENQKIIENEIHGYRQQIAALNGKLEQIENDSQNTLELMQVESDAFKQRVIELSKLIETLREEKQALVQQQVAGGHAASSAASNKLPRISEEDSQTDTAEDAVGVVSASAAANSAAAFELQMREELAALSDGAMQREEELIMYKERLEHMQTDNLELRREMQTLRQERGGMSLLGLDYTQAQLKRMLPFGAVVVAVIVYFITTYF